MMGDFDSSSEIALSDDVELKDVFGQSRGVELSWERFGGDVEAVSYLDLEDGVELNG